jgi:nicotinamidase/pyrazinamidase
MKKALIIVDMQYDFCQGGPISYLNSIHIIPIINKIRDNFDKVIFTKDLHSPNHMSFKESGGKYTKHCVEHTQGAEIHRDLIIKNIDMTINKGTLQMYDSNSVFYNAETIQKETIIKNILNAEKIKKIYFCGNSLDDCIFSSAIDSLSFKFETYVIEDAVSYSDKNNIDKCLEYLRSLGINIINSKNI